MTSAALNTASKIISDICVKNTVISGGTIEAKASANDSISVTLTATTVES